MALALVLVMLAPACSSREKTLVVFAAASLATPFKQLTQNFQDTHPGLTVTLQTGGSSTLATQIVQGAPVDVFVSAGPSPMKTVADAGLAGEVSPLTSNQLIAITPAGNPKGIKSLDELATRRLTVVVCQPEVPCGALTQAIFDEKKLQVTPASLEKDVTAVLTKVRLGEADAGLVYATDAKASGSEVYQIDDPVFAQHRTTYPVTVLKDAPQSELAAEFVQFVRSEPAQSLLSDHGFGAP